MFKNIFSSIKDINHVKVTKQNWTKIENLFAKKELKISEQTLEIDKLKEISKKQNEELINTRKYKKQDDLLFCYEKTCEKYKKENKVLKESLNDLKILLRKMDKKVESVMALENLYLERIRKAEYKMENLNSCNEYEEKGENLINLYT